MSTTNSPLGRGLAALLGDLDYTENLDSQSNLQKIPINNIMAGTMQPRQTFDPEQMAQLIESVREKGVLQPILVRESAQADIYEIIAGERRWRAAKDAELESVPAIIIECSDEEALEVGLIENLQRDDLNPLEEAESLKKLIDYFGKTQDEVAKSISKSRSYVANLLRLTTLPDYVKELIRSKKITAGHARTLVGSDHVDALVADIMNQNLSVRQAEENRRIHQDKMKNQNKIEPIKDPDITAVEQHLMQILELNTAIQVTRRGGTVKIYFETYEQLDHLVSKLTAKNNQVF